MGRDEQFAFLTVLILILLEDTLLGDNACDSGTNVHES